MTTFYIITIFPEAFESYLKASLLGKAQAKKLFKVHMIDLRRFATDKHKSVDDKAYGGGPGMVLKIEPIARAVRFVKQKVKGKTRVILFSTRGKVFDQKAVKRFGGYKNLILICGRYEGVDERVAKYIADEEVSIGNFVLSGGEVPAMVLLEAVSRHIPGVLGKYESLEEVKGSYPVYTRPEKFEHAVNKKKKILKVPEALLSGNHKIIEEWRKHSR